MEEGFWDDYSKLYWYAGMNCRDTHCEGEGLSRLERLKEEEKSKKLEEKKQAAPLVVLLPWWHQRH